MTPYGESARTGNPLTLSHTPSVCVGGPFPRLALPAGHSLHAPVSPTPPPAGLRVPPYARVSVKPLAGCLTTPIRCGGLTLACVSNALSPVAGTASVTVPMTTLADKRAWRFITEREGLVSRKAPRSARAIDAISEGYRVANVLFLANGQIEGHESRVLQLLETAAGHAAWADWGRRARNSIEDLGVINLSLARERRELVQRFGDESPDAA